MVVKIPDWVIAGLKWDGKCVGCGSENINHDPELSGCYICPDCKHDYSLQVIVTNVVVSRSDWSNTFRDDDWEKNDPKGYAKWAEENKERAVLRKEIMDEAKEKFGPLIKKMFCDDEE